MKSAKPGTAFASAPKGAQERFGFDQAYPISELDAKMAELLADQPALYYPIGADAAWDAAPWAWLNAVRASARAGVAAPNACRTCAR
jgi:Xaa-Pro aminopeptidase